jgi:MFS family permease
MPIPAVATSAGCALSHLTGSSALERQGEPKPRAARALAAGSISSFVNIATFIIYPFGVFASAMAADFGWTKVFISSLIGPALLVTVPAQPVIGWIINRFPLRAVAVASLALLALAMVLLGLAPPKAGLLTLDLVVAVALAALASPAVCSAIISENFDKGRGLALGVALGFTGLGVAIFPLLVSFMIDLWTWRVSFFVLSAIAGCCAIAMFVLVPTQSVRGSKPKDNKAYRRLVSAIARDSTFWRMVAIFVLLPLTANAIPLHLPFILEERGAEPRVAAMSLSVLGIVMIFARPLVGALLDRLPVRAVLTFMIAGPLAASVALLLSRTTLTPIVAAAGFGLTIGGEFTCLGYMVSRAFGVPNFGIVYGWLSMSVATGVACGPIAISKLLSLGHGYTPSLYLTCGASALSLLISWTLDDARFRASR